MKLSGTFCCFAKRVFKLSGAPSSKLSGALSFPKYSRKLPKKPMAKPSPKVSPHFQSLTKKSKIFLGRPRRATTPRLHGQRLRFQSGPHGHRQKPGCLRVFAILKASVTDPWRVCEQECRRCSLRFWPGMITNALLHY